MKEYTLCHSVMFILLILFSQVCSDWVEISQNHYRNEPAHKVNFEYTTKSNRLYRNNSVTDVQWHRAVVDKVANVGNIRQVQYPRVNTSSVKTRPEDNGFNKNLNDHKTTNAEYNFVSAKPNSQRFNTNDGDDDQNNVSWTTAANIDRAKHPYSKPIKTLPTLVENFDRSNIFDEKQNEEEYNAFNQRKVFLNTPPIEKINKNIGKIDLNENDKFYTIAKPSLHRVFFNNEVKLGTSKIIENSDASKEFSTTTNIKPIQSEDNKYVKENHEYKQVNPSTTEMSKIKYNPYDTSSHLLEEYLNFRNKSGHIDKRYNNIHSEETIVNKAKPVQDVHKEITSSTDAKVTTIPKTEDTRPKDISNESKGNTMKGMWKFMKLVTDTIYKNTHRSFKSKIKYLESLKTTILSSIEDQIDRAWPDDAGERGSSRRARSAQARGHVEFPSSESTLMTISFLTFAVFVIKLVLQVIHTYKNKTMMVTPAVVAAVGRAAAAFKTPK